MFCKSSPSLSLILHTALLASWKAYPSILESSVFRVSLRRTCFHSFIVHLSLILGGLVDWQVNDEFAALTGLAFDFDGATVHLHQVPCDQ